MKITLDESGMCMPDANMMSFAKEAVRLRMDVHVANIGAVDCLRAVLFKTKLMDRPIVDWKFYGETVNFDSDLRSHDAWDDPRTHAHMAALEILLDPRNKGK